MRRYDDPIEVRRGPEEGPEQFLWRGRLWHVRAVVAHWMETGPWWHSPGVRAVVGTLEDDSGQATPATSERALAAAAQRVAERGGTATLVEPDLLTHDLLREREVWRVEARPGRADERGFGVYDLVHDWSTGSWRLAGCLD